MEQKRSTNIIPNYMLCFSLLFTCSMFVNFSIVEAYKNYTVGDSLGWFDKLNKPSVDYDKWASGKSFSLGDFLIFNTDSNHTVIQTYNSKTYTTCDSQGDDDDIQWSNIEPNSTDVRPITVAVPLLKEGTTYFFSGDYDGEQCINGQKFSVKVTHGQGLPPSIRDNPDYAAGPTGAADAAPGPANPDSGDDQSAPDTIISSDFNHPKKVPASEDSTSSDDEDDGTSGKRSNDGFGLMVTWEMLLVSIVSGLWLHI